MIIYMVHLYCAFLVTRQCCLQTTFLQLTQPFDLLLLLLAPSPIFFILLNQVFVWRCKVSDDLVFAIMYAGISYRSSTMNLYDSVQSGSLRENRFLIVQENSNLSTSTAIVMGSGSSEYVLPYKSIII